MWGTGWTRSLLLALLLVWLGAPIAHASPLALIGSRDVDFHPGSWSERIYRCIIGQAGEGLILVLSRHDETHRIPTYFRHL